MSLQHLHNKQAIIIANTSNHLFKIGQEVILKHDESCSSIEICAYHPDLSEFWWVIMDDIKITAQEDSKNA